MNKKFVAEVLKLEPAFAASGLYFYEKPVGHILCGFLCECPPSGPYIWKYAFPLYDRFRRLHLGFGDRLPASDGFMDATHRRADEHAAEFVRRIEPYRSAISALAQPDRFCEYLEARYVETGISARNHHIRRGYVMTLIMLGRQDAASEELAALCEMDRVKQDRQAMSDLAKLQADLTNGIEVAQENLRLWEAETKRSLDLIEK